MTTKQFYLHINKVTEDIIKLNNSIENLKNYAYHTNTDIKTIEFYFGTKKKRGSLRTILQNLFNMLLYLKDDTKK